MKEYVFAVTYCYFGFTKVRKVIVEAQNLNRAWNKVVRSESVDSPLVDIRFVSCLTDEK